MFFDVFRAKKIFFRKYFVRSCKVIFKKNLEPSHSSLGYSKETLVSIFLIFLLKNHVFWSYLGEKIFFRKKFFGPQLELIISDFLSHHPNFSDERAQRAQQMSKSIPPPRHHHHHPWSTIPISWVWSETDQTKNF